MFRRPGEGNVRLGRRLSTAGSRPGIPRAGAARRLTLEPLEDRQLLSLEPVMGVGGLPPLPTDTDISAESAPVTPTVFGVDPKAIAYPSNYDQYMLELINRGRADPAAEAARYGINLNEGLAAGTITTAPKQPLAINPYLVDSARNHSQWMLATGTFDHPGAGGSSPGDRMTAAGYVFTLPYEWGENIAWYGNSAGLPPLDSTTATLHQVLFVDAGYDGRGHRLNLMEPEYRELGVGLVTGTFQGYPAAMVTQDFASSGSGYFLTGVVYNDHLVSHNQFYTPGEGLGGVTITVTRQSDGASFSATTWSSGGYSVALDAGSYAVTASGGALGRTISGPAVTILSSNVKVDFTTDMPSALGTIDFLRLSNQQPSGGELLYQLAAFRDGVLTAELTAGNFGPNAAMEFSRLDDSGNPQVLATGQARVDYLAAAAGQTYFLRVTGLGGNVDLVLANLVQFNQGGTQATVYGTQGNDTFEASAGTSPTITINGVQYQSGSVASLHFLGNGGADSATLSGSGGDESAVLQPMSGTVTGPGYDVQLTDVARIAVQGGGGSDTAYLFDSRGNDTFTAGPTQADLSVPASPFFYEPGLDPALGFNLISWDFDQVGASNWENAVEDLYAHGFRSVSFVPIHFVDLATGMISGGTATADIAAGMARAHQLGMTVTVNPVVEPQGYSTWRGYVDFSEPVATTFFDQYPAWLLELAQAAQSNGAARMTIGSELNALVENADHAGHWASVIAAADGAFGGQLGYAANWDDYQHANVTAAIWENSAIDFVGVDAYFPLATDAQADASGAYRDETFVGTVQNSWNGILDNILGFAAQRKGGVGMPVLLTEHGLIPYNRATVQPWSTDPASTQPPDPDEQISGYDALLRATDHRGDRVAGIELWQWGWPGARGSYWYTHPDAVDDPSTAADESLGNRAGRFLSNYVSSAIPEPATLQLSAGNVATVHAYAMAGGYDVASLYDSAGNDTFSATPKQSVLSGPGFYLRAKKFDAVHAYATAGGTDVAYLNDSAGDDTLVATTAEAVLSGPGFYEHVQQFDVVHAYAAAGGSDVAKLYDSAGDDTFYGFSNQAILSGAGFYNRVKLFDVVHAYASAGGTDVAKLYDSAGDDTFYADPLQAMLWGENYYTRAKFFDVVHAYATAGGRDMATLVGSDGNDRFVGSPTESILWGAGFYNRAKFFEEVIADALTGADDKASLYDSALDDLLTAAGDTAQLDNVDLGSLYQALHFDRVIAYGTTGTNQRSVQPPLDFALYCDGPWEDI